MLDDNIFDQDGYPRDETLAKIRTWKLSEQGVREFVEFIRAAWAYPHHGFKLRGVRILYLELHTIGWSGNEEVISAIEDNWLFWSMCWQKSTRGGHYYFRIDTRLFELPT